jgi:hypothetical protein
LFKVDFDAFNSIYVIGLITSIIWCEADVHTSRSTSPVLGMNAFQNARFEASKQSMNKNEVPKPFIPKNGPNLKNAINWYHQVVIGYPGSKQMCLTLQAPFSVSWSQNSCTCLD